MDSIFSRAAGDEEFALDSQDISNQYPVLESLLEPLKPYYTHPEVEEICLNRPRELWLKRSRPKEGESLWCAVKEERATFGYLERLFKVIANTYEEAFDPENSPTLYAALPGGHRFSGGMYKHFVYDEIVGRGGVVFSIRQAPRDDNLIDYDAYGLTPGKIVTAPLRYKEKKEKGKDSLEKLKFAIKDSSHILISGATSTGKTTLLNKIIADLDESLRVVSVEDTRELKIPHRNRFHIVLSRTKGQTKEKGFNDAAAIDLLTRMTPDVIVCGEVSTSNASTIWELTGSGHGSMMTTIHAEDPATALSTFVQRIQHTKPAENEENLIKEMKKRFTVVQIKRHPITGKREITHVETFKD